MKIIMDRSKATLLRTNDPFRIGSPDDLPDLNGNIWADPTDAAAIRQEMEEYAREYRPLLLMRPFAGVTPQMTIRRGL